MATKWAEGRPRFGSAHEEACRRGGSRPVYTHRRFFDGVMCKHDASFSPADCVKFMSALLEFDDHLDMLYRLTKPQEHGLTNLRLALRSSDSPQFLAQSVVPFLVKLGHDRLNSGMCRKPLLQVLDTITAIPGLLPALGEAITSGSLPDATPVAWFALTLAVNSEAARANPELKALVQPLLACGGGAATAARQLKQVLSPAGPGLGSSGQAPALEDLRVQAGGRHDNDAPNFRDIKIVPTSEEASCSHPPYLPLAPSIQQTTPGVQTLVAEVSGGDHEAAEDIAKAPEVQLLDRHFRLLREDMVAPLRDVLRTLTQWQQLDGNAARGAPNQAAMQQVLRNVYHQVSVLGVCKQQNRVACVMLSFALPHGHQANRLRTITEKEDFWDKHGRGTMPLNALVCLASPGDPLLFGTVVRREPKEMAEALPLVGVSFEAGRGLEQVLAWIGRTLANKVLVQVSTNLLSIRPVLEGLQALPTVPLAEELVYGQAPQRPSYLTAIQLKVVMAQQQLALQLAGRALDPSQAAALERGLGQCVALIQGPPGTGKSFIGVMLSQAIVRHSQETILCVCYTNHALDQFLEALLDKGIKDIVRIGGQCKSTRLAPYNVRELTKSKQGNSLADSCRRRTGTLHDSLRAELMRVEDIERQLAALQPPVQQRVLRQRQGGKPGEQEWVESPFSAWYRHQNGIGKEQAEYEAKRNAQRGRGSNSNDDEKVEDNGLLPQPRLSLWQVLLPSIMEDQPDEWEQWGGEHGFYKWCQGVLTPNGGSRSASWRSRHRPQAEAVPESAQGNLWRLSPAERDVKLRSWIAAKQQELCEDLAACMQKVNDMQVEMKDLRNSDWEAVLKKARVIGCTVTGAASNKALLDALQPGVLLVEEAGELLEAHVLTSLSTKAKHLVLIGDHKQLRPKVESYSLQKESGRGYDLNVSLFERLVLAGFPHASLAVQHRMHPDISRLVRPTYPALHDHPSVAQHPAVKGLGQHRVVFIHHEVPEDGEDSNSGWHASKMQQSKVNSHEVGMVRAVVTYLLQQGYAKEQLVVLTPYLGQLLELKQALAKEMGAAVDEMDMADLRKAVLPQLLANLGVEDKDKDKQQGSSGVRLATIDNYQGEESDIVVASLVRSNSAGKVGFLKEPERINVLLSRARHGMILIGNADTLRNASSSAAKSHWGRVLTAMGEAGQIHTGLPAVCQRHQRPILPVLDSPAAFLQRSPDGGCCEPCSATLPCGHPCELRCHVGGHGHMKCKVQVTTFCPAGHVHTRLCSNPDAPCPTCMELRRVEDEEAAKLKKLEAEAARKRSASETEAVRLRGKAAALQQQLRALEDDLRRRKELMAAEMEAKKLELALELQKAQAPAQLAAWAAEQEHQAVVDQAAQEERAAAERLRLEADKLAAEQAAQQAKLMKEMADQERQLAASSAQLQQAEAYKQRELQRIENDKRKVVAESASRREVVEGKAQAQLLSATTALKWREAVAAAGRDGAAGLEALRQLLQQAAQEQQEGSQQAADTLDTVFGYGSGRGARLLQYAAAPPAAEDQLGMSAPAAHKQLKRGLALMGEAKWIQALEFFEAQAANTSSNAEPTASLPSPQPYYNSSQDTRPVVEGASSKSSKTSEVVLAACTMLCKAKLGFAPPPAPRSLLRVPAMPSSGGKTDSAWPDPLQHLSKAVSAAAQAKSGQGGRQQPGQSAAVVVGEALACLLHPGTPAWLPAPLQQLAQGLLSEHAATFAATGPMLSGPAPGAGQPGEVPAGWLQRAKSSQALSKLLQLTGLEPVKREMFNLADQVELEKSRKRDLNSRQYNICFYGNPGTGKTTVARIYAALLKELGVLPDAQVVETSGSALANGGVEQLKKELTKLEKGGVLFLDEAYQLNPKTNPSGAAVLDYLLPEMENRRGKLVTVLAGYQKQMEALLGYNEGLPSRFSRCITFPDYSDKELLKILLDIIAEGKPQPFKMQDEKHARIAARRLGRQRGTVGFGNARAVRNFYEQAVARQSARCVEERQQGLNPDLWLLRRDDLLGPKQLDVSSSSALQELQAKVGLQSVKDSVANLLQLIRTNAELEEAEKPVKEVALNRVFLGNPGTGKTTIAGIYGRVLRDLGLLSKGDVVVKNPSDFLGSVLGESEQKTVAILDAAVGCVLVIDEAYSLNPGSKSKDPYKEAVIDTIVAKVQGVPGDDRCVLLLGYEEPMQALMREANPGLARRFQLANAWTFQDYNDEELLAIMKEAARRKGWELGWPELKAGVQVLDKERRRPNFGNAGAVSNLLATVAMRMEARMQGLSDAARAAAQPVAADFLPPEDAKAVRADQVFKDLVGCKEVLAKLKEWQATIKASQRMGKDPLDSFELNFRFVGAPGTGKTTVARRVGMLFKSLGLLSTDEVTSCSASDFMTGYAGQTAGQTRKLFETAVGGVLFIDEAYRLNPASGNVYGREALDEIVQLLTEPRFMKKMVVILAGYEAEIDQLLTANPGLKSRFSERLHFPDFSCKDACSLLRKQIETKHGLELDPKALAGLPNLMQKLIAAPGWSNGRDVGTWADRVFRTWSLRTTRDQEQAGSEGGEGGEAVSLADLQQALESCLASKADEPASSKPAGPLLLPPHLQQMQHAPAPAAPAPPAPVRAPPAVAQAAPVVVDQSAPPAPSEQAEQQEDAAELSAVASAFDRLGPEFLADLQGALEQQGHDLSNEALVQRLAGDGSLPDALLPLLARSAGSARDLGMLREMVRQWQRAVQQQMELQRKLAKKGKRPVWRCNACGRYGCPVAPYIERYEEVDLP